ncbi:hypothetical protein ELS19_16670 [Halogeometricum borinquense]|uniref:DUF8068 domain-containing protein n=1 Tax=Halogeometricum borinquense TaxID=60847 RepID=A0A482SXK2_9EURY|nr:hypothetical protein [Halogeometricum borinquense]RYJ08198.1 hypothetical protein ELS19_16670 [Halogeometricum borinquense]
MSSRRATEATNERLDATIASLSNRSPIAIRPLAGVLALVPILGTLLYRIGNNVPGSLSASVTELVTVVLPFVAVGPAFAGLLLAAATDRPGERVGLAFVGGFGLIALAARGAWYPAAAGVVFGGLFVTGSIAVRSWRSDRLEGVRYPVVAAVLVVAVVASIVATAGISPATFRPLGSSVALFGIGLTPVLVGTDRLSLAAGVVAGALALNAAITLPFVTGAVLLVGGGVVGAPIALVVFAVGGGVAGLIAALRRGQFDRACGAGVLLAAGVPAVLLQALGVFVALALLADEPGGDAL